MSRVYEALKNVQEQRTVRGPLPGPGIPLESDGAETSGNGHAASRIPEILAAVRPEGAPAAAATGDRQLQFEELQQRCAKPGWKQNARWAVFPNQGPAERQAEQFHTLRARLYSLRETRPIKTLLVTSTTVGEGKTFVAMNLAQSIARQRGRRALLIDADLRVSRLHIALGAPSAPGLSDYLAGEADECSIVQTDAQESLFFIPAGKPSSDPAELLGNNQMQTLLSRVLPLFDWIIVDAPPVLPVSDAGVLAGKCDGVIFVVRAGVAAFDMAQAACAELKNRNLLGVVLNGVEEQAIYGAYGYY
jgi:capsular exopolysaccharide synthesis family protein